MSRAELVPRPAPAPVALDGVHLELGDLVRVAREGAPVALTEAAAARVAASRERLDRIASSGTRLYGLNTGIGALEREREDGDGDIAARQASLLRSHAAGVGAPMRDDQVRAMIAVRANQLAAGKSGVGPAALAGLIELLNRDLVPVVPELGSVGASDLAPLAHAALVLLGEGSARVAGAVHPARAALAAVGLSPVALAGRDALALINGLGQTVAVGGLAVWDARCLIHTAEAVSAVTLCAMGAPTDFLDPHLAREKRHAGQEESSRRARELVGAARPAPPSAPLLRAPLSLRYAPQVFGAARTALELAGRVVAAELDAAVDNPFLDDDGFATSNSPLTSGQELGQALDLLAMSLTAVAVAGERRVAALLDERMSGLPGFLRHPRSRAGVDSGFMIAQYTAAALVAEMRARSGAASIQSIPTCAGVEDQVSMCAIAARHAAWTVERAEMVAAIELLCAAQAADLAGRALPARLAALVDALRARVPVQIEDRLLGDDIQSALAVVRDGGREVLSPG
jgi:histidine ammonia-lyase